MNGVTAMDENGGDIRSPIKRLGSTRKLLIFNNIRLQLNEQLRCLDVRMESQVSLIQELQDFFRRRGEVELDYSKSLDKLAKSLQLRHKEQKHKREQWPMFSSYACWQQMVNQTKSLSKDHAALSEIYSNHLVARLQTVIEDVQRIYKKCREIGYETHEEILRVLQELHTTMKTYHSYQTECKAAEVKLRTAENQRLKLQQTIPKEKLDRSKKYRLIEKEMLKRKNKYTDARLKALKAKNEYQLCLEASNTTIHKYFVEDLSDLIDCMDLGFHSMVSRALLMHVTADQGRCRAVLHNADTLSHTVHSMDSRADKQKFLEQHHGAFMIPKRLEFQGQLGDDVVEPELQKALYAEMEARLEHLGQRVSNLRTESEEIWKTLETAEINLLEILNTKDYDSSSHFGDSTTQSAKPESLTIKLKTDKQEIEEFYITKIREYILGTSRIARLDSKAELLRNALAKDSVLHSNSTLLAKANVPKRKRIGRMNMTGQPKLFGGSLEEYLEATGEEIPLIMRSCIRIINLYGLHHQGIFRVSGSQVEISNFREGFERGEDPLADTTDASDINSVAGVLKLYLRELREPLFPIIYFDHFVTLAQLESKHELVLGIRKFLQSLPRAVIIVIRYLFAFLNHLSEYSDENMMDAYNLAICFGPTLMPAPEDKDQVQYQNQVNELIKNLIVFHGELFPKDLGGFVYEKYISTEPFDCDVGDSPTDQVTEDPDSEVYPSEDESDTMEATAQFDFNARSNRELSLRKGDQVTLRKQVSNDWWQGTVRGKDGLVPDKYISLKIKDEDRDKCSDHLKSSSSEESVRKRRPSGNISINSQLSIFSQSSATNEAEPVLSTSTAVPSATSGTAALQQKQCTQVLTSNQLNEKIDSTIGIPIKGAAVVQQHHNQQQSNAADNDFHYDTVDNVKLKYNYHDEPHSFENSMEFLEDYNHFQYENKRPEPIYAEPSKTSNPQTAGSSSTSNNLHFDEYDGSVTFRKHQTATSSPKLDTHSNKTKPPGDHFNSIISSVSATDDEKSRHSDTVLFKDVDLRTVQQSGNNEDTTARDNIRPTRKYHSKSFSLSENRIAAGSNLFHQNRELWEKRAELQSQQCLTTPRILSRNRIAPDLVMDLPFQVVGESGSGVGGGGSSGDGGVDAGNCTNGKDGHNSRDSIDGIDVEDLTSAERFASANQCTLKKNERFSSDSYESKKEVKLDFTTTKTMDKPKAEVKPQEITTNITSTSDDTKMYSEDVLHIEEDNRDHKSPIPTRNTKKFVTQFADLHLTGGCFNAASSGGNDSTAITTASSGSLISSQQQQQQQQSFSSFKPQVKVKPQLMKKPLVLPPTTPEMSRRHHQD